MNVVNFKVGNKQRLEDNRRGFCGTTVRSGCDKDCPSSCKSWEAINWHNDTQWLIDNDLTIKCEGMFLYAGMAKCY